MLHFWWKSIRIGCLEVQHASNAEKVISMYPALPTRMVHWCGVCWCTMYICIYPGTWHVHWYMIIMVISTLRKRSQPACTRVKIAKKTPTLVQRKLVRPWPDWPDRFRRPCFSVAYLAFASAFWLMLQYNTLVRLMLIYILVIGILKVFFLACVYYVEISILVVAISISTA